MANAMVALANLTLGSAQSTVTFSSIPATYRDLRLVVQYKNTNDGIQAMIRVNGDSGTNYSSVGMAGYGASSASSWSNNITRIQAINYTGVLNSEFCLLEMDFMDYSVTDKQKTILTRSNHSGEVDALASRWANTAAITSILLLPETGTFASGSTFALYGIAS